MCEYHVVEYSPNERYICTGTNSECTFCVIGNNRTYDEIKLREMGINFQNIPVDKYN